MYLHALYYAYITISHAGVILFYQYKVGDVCGVNLKEKVFGIFVMLISTFTSAYFFGNLASMIHWLYNIIYKVILFENQCTGFDAGFKKKL